MVVNAARYIKIMIWLSVVMLSAEVLFFGNGGGVGAALIISDIGIFLETKEKA
jgi:hypothetical protein